MATQPPTNLPLFYKNLVPLQNGVHGDYRSRTSDKAPFLVGAHAIPVTVDEFVLAQRHFPIVFSSGDNPVPLALFGLNEGVNVFINDDGSLANQNIYLPAYIRRYPWMLAKLRPESEELSLCFDPDSDLVGASKDGLALFDGDQPSEATTAILKFCEEFEIAAQRTTGFIKELQDADLLMEGEVAIQTQDNDQPYVYRGFQMVSEEKLRDLRGDVLRKFNQNGILPLIVAHLFSLALVREIFGMQAGQGRIPGQTPVLAS